MFYGGHCDFFGGNENWSIFFYAEKGGYMQFKIFASIFIDRESVLPFIFVEVFALCGVVLGNSRKKKKKKRKKGKGRKKPLDFVTNYFVYLSWWIRPCYEYYSCILMLPVPLWNITIFIFIPNPFQATTSPVFALSIERH